MTLGSATFGDSAGSVGQITLAGAGSTLNVVGTLTLGGAGSAVLTLGKGTSFNVGSLFIGPGGVLAMSGGSLGGYATTIGPGLTAGLKTFFAGTATNGTTADATVSGTVSAPNSLVSLRAGLDSAAPAGYADITGTIASGTFTVTAAELTALNGGVLPDGRYVLHLIATDALGIQTKSDVTIGLQTAAPSVQGFGLTQSSAIGGTGNTTANAVVTLTGTTTPGAQIALVEVPGAKTVAGANGVFQLANIPVIEGDNVFTVTATNGVGMSAQAQVTVTRQGTASADVAMQWNQVVLNTISDLNVYPTDGSRLLAIVSLAQYDTLAAIEGTQAYMVQETVSGPVSEQAALAQTAYEVLVNLFPLLKPMLRRRARDVPAGHFIRPGADDGPLTRHDDRRHHRGTAQERRLGEFRAVRRRCADRRLDTHGADVPAGDRSAMGQRDAVRHRQRRCPCGAARPGAGHLVTGMGQFAEPGGKPRRSEQYDAYGG